jgi:hypothetical protein
VRTIEPSPTARPIRTILCRVQARPVIFNESRDLILVHLGSSEGRIWYVHTTAKFCAWTYSANVGLRVWNPQGPACCTEVTFITQAVSLAAPRPAQGTAERPQSGRQKSHAVSVCWAPRLPVGCELPPFHGHMPGALISQAAWCQVCPCL